MTFATKSMFLILIVSIAAHAQDIRLVNAWQARMGDIPKDSVAHISASRRVYLSYDNPLTLQFVGRDSLLRFRIATTEQFAYWHDLGQGGVLQVPLLTGDNYVLEITDHSQHPYRLTLSIEQTFWQKWWFWPLMAVYALFLVGISIYLFVLYNLRQKLKMQDVRNRIAADLHDEVGSNLNAIAIFVELLRKKAPADLQELLDKIKNNSTESVQLMQDTIWAIQPKNDDFEKFTAKMRSFAFEILATKNIALDFCVAPQHSWPQLTMEVRKNVYLIFKEAINNIAKHAQATKAIVEMSYDTDGFRLVVSDNGRGFDTTQPHEGNGLRNFETRAEASEMTIKISSEIGVGTTVEVRV